MKLIYTIAALAAFNMATAQKTIDLKDFKNLTLGSDMKVTLIKSTSNKLVTTGSEDDDLKITNEGGGLNISGSDGMVTLYYKNAIENIAVGSDAVVTGNDEIKTKNLNIAADSDAKVVLKVNVQKLQTSGRSDASITLSGTATDHTVSISSDANLQSENLISENTTISLSSDAKAVITAKGNVTANVSSDASLKIHGNPKNVTQTKGSDATIEIIK